MFLCSTSDINIKDLKIISHNVYLGAYLEIYKELNKAMKFLYTNLNVRA